MLKLDVERAEPLIIFFEFVNTKQGLLKYSLILEAIIPIIPSCKFGL